MPLRVMPSKVILSPEKLLVDAERVHLKTHLNPTPKQNPTHTPKHPETSQNNQKHSKNTSKTPQNKYKKAQKVNVTKHTNKVPLLLMVMPSKAIFSRRNSRSTPNEWTPKPTSTHHQNKTQHTVKHTETFQNTTQNSPNKKKHSQTLQNT